MAEFERQIVYAKLDWAWSWRGIGIKTLLFGAFPGVCFFVVATIQGWMLLTVPVMVAGMVFSCALDYRQKQNLLVRLIWAWHSPRHLAPVVPTQEPPPFPVPREALQ